MHDGHDMAHVHRRSTHVWGTPLPCQPGRWLAVPGAGWPWAQPALRPQAQPGQHDGEGGGDAQPLRHAVAQLVLAAEEGVEVRGPGHGDPPPAGGPEEGEEGVGGWHSRATQNRWK